MNLKRSCKIWLGILSLSSKLEQLFSNVSMCPNHLENLLKQGVGLTPQISEDGQELAFVPSSQILV